MAPTARVRKAAWADRRPGPGAVIWFLLLAFIAGSGYIAISGLIGAVRESGPNLVLSDQRSTVNNAFFQLEPISSGDRANLPPLERTIAAGTTVWLLDHGYSDGGYGRGTYALTLFQEKSSCWDIPGRCHVTVTYGYCRGSCVTLLPPIASFSHPLDRSFAGLQHNQDVQAPAVTLTGCPCHYYLRLDTFAPAGVSWNLAYGPGMYTELDPANAQITQAPIFLTIGWFVGSVLVFFVVVLIWGAIAGLFRTVQSSARALPVKRLAEANGLMYSATDNGADASKAADMLGLGERIGIDNALHGLWRELPVVAGDFWYVPRIWFMPNPGSTRLTSLAGAVDAITTRFRSVAVGTTAGRLPFVSIRRGSGGIQIGVAGLEVHSEDENFARRLVDTRLASWLLQCDPRYEFALEGDRVLISCHLLRAERIGEMLDTLRSFVDQVPPDIWRVVSPVPVETTMAAV